MVSCLVGIQRRLDCGRQDWSGVWCAVIKGLDSVEDGMASLGEGGEALVIDHFIFEAAPEAFDEDAVVVVAMRLMEAARPCWARIRR